MNEEDTLNYLASIVKNKNFSQNELEIQSTIRKMADIQVAYEYERYNMQPLVNPSEVKCYYFRNKSGVFFDEFSPYYWILEDEADLDHINYWSLWEQNMPNIEIIDVDSSNHMVLFHEEKIYTPIVNFCKNLYSNASASYS